MAPLTLMTWNVRYFAHGTRGLVTTAAHLRRTAWALAAHDPLPDVLALQEVEHGSRRGGSRPQLDAFVEALHAALDAQRRPTRFQGLYFPVHRYQLGDTSLYTTGLAVLVRDGIAIGTTATDDVTAYRLPWFARFKQRRMAVRVEVRPPDWHQDLVVCNTHLSLPAFFEVGPTRVPERMGYGSNQLAEVDGVLRALDSTRPTVVAGDFNALPGSPAYARIRAAGWSDGPVDHSRPTAGFLHHRMHIDHVFGSAAVRLSDVRVVTSLAPLSDHAPKLARVELA